MNTINLPPKPRPLTPQERQADRDRKHAQNRDLAELTREIVRLEDTLANLYRQRAGRVEWTATGDCAHGWCSSCGRNRVFPNEGQDTCSTCVHMSIIES